MAAHDTLRDVPELFETALGESLVTRTDQIPQFRLGPPDLCHLVKTNPKHQKDVTSYHYVSGVDASSPGSLAAYINTLNYSMDNANAAHAKSSSWFGGTSSASHYRIKSGVYCCYNAFAMIDVRVEVRIPGGVNVYGVNRAGKRVAIHPDSSPTFWAELFVSGALRAMLVDSPDVYPPGPPALRRVDPLPDLNVEARFLEAARDVFPRGWQLGPNPDVQVPSLTSNLLVCGLTRYFGIGAGRWDVLAKLWRELLPVDASVASLLAETYMMADQDAKAVRLLHQTLMAHPNCTPVLLAQIDLLQKKNKHDMALTIAKRLVNTAPLEFKAWEKLTQCYTAVGDWPMALLALNSCPMFAHPPREFPLMPEPARSHFPGTDALDEFTDNDTQTLTPLRAEGLRGTFRRAYTLLAAMVDKAGWEELLGHRAAVFVMEDEYRQVKEEELMPVANEHVGDVTTPVGDENGSKHPSTAAAAAAAGATPTSPTTNEVSVDPVANQAAAEPLEADQPPQTPPEGTNAAAAERERAARAELWRNLHANRQSQQAGNASAHGSNKLLTAFSHKRLCERWLDDLFLMLYEDLRVYTAWKAEEAHAREYRLAYKRTAAEWEYLGDLARRLGKAADARGAYRQCTEIRFSPKASLRLLALQTEPDAASDFKSQGPEAASRAAMLAALNNVGRMLALPGHNLAVLYRVYGDLTYPNPLASAVFALITQHGLARIQTEVLSLNFPPPVFKRVTHFLEYAEKFHVRGWDA
ncbi:Chs5p-Arf1p-binding proteins-domain-containing protein [Catenaria anguillulae PL171]|uniref:Chs5p-Arf1p-binding proteins-domain-containing protein n=1 Tax=Catenaria anguillulae PL171 TaxID=765915 RepID=A0A1Y2HQV6_9FUNG|nr:Chs5p-Arf1p-binding proteins-domain-containing protein [Catenaria anguillulae PL171]